jgi:hypothetical protein
MRTFGAALEFRMHLKIAATDPELEKGSAREPFSAV